MPTALFVYVVFCFVVGFLGRKSNMGFVRGVLLSFLLTPTVVLIYLLVFASIEK